MTKEVLNKRTQHRRESTGIARREGKAVMGRELPRELPIQVETEAGSKRPVSRDKPELRGTVR